MGRCSERQCNAGHYAFLLCYVSFILLYATGWDDGPKRLFGSWPRSARVPLVQQVVSPWNSRRYVLAAGAESAGSLPGLVRQIFSEGTLEQLKGDTAALGGRQVACSSVARQQKLQESSYFTHLEAWF